MHATPGRAPPRAAAPRGSAPAARALPAPSAEHAFARGVGNRAYGARVSAAPVAVQRQRNSCELREEEEPVQRSALDAGGQATPAVQDAVAEMRGRGAPLPPGERSFFEPRLGRDLGGVRVHTGAAAAQASRDLHARAFTVGRDIAFAAGEFRPGTVEGRRLMAHELTHTLQQSGAAGGAPGGQGQLSSLEEEQGASRPGAVLRHPGPVVQRLVVTPDGPLHTGTCGEYAKRWIFSLDSPAPEDGYIVQRVDMYEDIKDCPGMVRCLANPTFTFWEAWWLEKGDVRQHIHDKVGWTDRARRSAAPGKSGSHAALGEIRFFKKSTTGDLGRESVASSDPASVWAPGKVPLSGWLPSTTDPPAWWTSSVEGPATRSAFSDWACCANGSQWSKSRATPE